MGLKYVYRGFRTEFQYDIEEKIYWGTLINAKKGDSVSFHGNTLFEAVGNFVDSVNEYIELCNELNKGVKK